MKLQLLIQREGSPLLLGKDCLSIWFEYTFVYLYANFDLYVNFCEWNISSKIAHGVIVFAMFIMGYQ